MTDYSIFNELEVFKVYDSYEIHYCDFIITARPGEIIAITGEVDYDDDDGTVSYTNADFCLSPSANKKGIFLDLHYHKENILMGVSIKFKDQHLQVDITSWSVDYRHSFTVNVTNRISRVKRARV